MVTVRDHHLDPAMIGFGPDHELVRKTQRNDPAQDTQASA
jgi:hypothetical protein